MSAQTTVPSRATTLLFDIPTSWCFGFLFPTSITWLTIQSYALLTSRVLPLLPTAWAVLSFLILCSLCGAFTVEAPPLPLSGERPRANIAPLMFLIWLITAAVTFALTSVVDGHVQAPQFLIKDFFSHIAIIRSFSQGENFPTEYPFFAGPPIQYHFLFYFGASILERLGLPFLSALNIPTWLTLASFLSLVSFLAWRISGRVVAAYLAPAFCMLRSSLSWIDNAIFQIRSLLSIDPIPKEAIAFGSTPLEDWGIFTPNVQLNQRHLVFGFCLLLIALISCLTTTRLKIREYAVAFISLGALVGIGAYWNGATFIATIMGLSVLLLPRENRPKVFLAMLVAIVCNMALTLAVTQGHPTSTPLSPRLAPGFLAPTSSLYDISMYALWILGPLPFVALVGAYLFGPPGRLIWLSGFAPIAIIFLFQLTPYPEQGHKFINSGMLIWSTLSASAIALMLSSAASKVRLLAAALGLSLIAAGILDVATLFNLGRTPASAPINTALVGWISDNTPVKSLFLSAPRGDVAIFAAGRKTFQGPYELTKDARYPYQERAKLLVHLASQDAETQVKELKKLSIGYILSGPCPLLPPRLASTCVEQEEISQLSRNPLLREAYTDSESHSVILEVP